MSGQTTRAEKELNRVLKSPEAKSHIELLKASFEPFRSYIGLKQFENWLSYMQFFREHDGRIKVKGNPRFLSETEKLFFERLDFFKEFTSQRLRNPVTTFPITILRKVLFDEIGIHKYLGISHEIMDENEGYLHPHARLYIEPGASIEDAREYLQVYGDDIRQHLNSYLPENHHLRKSLRAKTVEERNKFIASLKADSVPHKEIQILVSSEGYKPVSLNIIAKIKPGHDA